MKPKFHPGKVANNTECIKILQRMEWFYFISTRSANNMDAKLAYNPHAFDCGGITVGTKGIVSFQRLFPSQCGGHCVVLHGKQDSSSARSCAGSVVRGNTGCRSASFAVIPAVSYHIPENVLSDQSESC